MASRFSRFLAELKRRKVGRVLVLYPVVGIGVIEAAQLLLSAFELPHAAFQVVTFLVILGFPVALVLAWALELTPDGIKRTEGAFLEEVAADEREPWKPGRWVLMAAGILAVVTAAALLHFRDPSVSPGPSIDTTQRDQGHLVAAFPFENLLRDSTLSDLGQIAQHQVTAGLTWAEELRAIPANTVLQIRRAEPDSVPDRDVALSLGASVMVNGQITSFSGEIGFQAQITILETGEALPVVEVTCPAAEPMTGIQELQQRVVGSLVGYLGSARGSRALALATPTYDAVRAYLLGMDRLAVNDGIAARGHFYDAYALDSTFLSPLFSSVLVNAYWGSPTQADSLLGILRARRDELSPQDWLQMDYLSSLINWDWDEALVALRVMARRDPGAWALVASAALGAGRPREALAAVERIDPRFMFGRLQSHYFRTGAHAQLGQWEELLAAAQEGRREFSSDVLLHTYEIEALICLDQLDEIWPKVDVLETLETGGDGFMTPARALLQLAGYLQMAGRSTDARLMAERAFSWARNAEDRVSRAESLLFLQRHGEAIEVLSSLLESVPGNITVRGLFGVALALSGNLEGARRQEAWLAELDRPYLNRQNQYWQAAILAHLGEEAGAVSLLRMAKEKGWSHRGLDPMEPLLEPLWDYEPYQELLEPRG
jgi:tetratricopeptide (TPR) repeat protein